VAPAEHRRLNDSLGINLVNIEREQAAGSFSVDLVGENDSGATVVILDLRTQPTDRGQPMTQTGWM